MSLQKKFNFPPETRLELECSKIPLAVYQYIDGRIKAILVSDGLLALQGPGITRDALLERISTDLYKNIHRDDLPELAKNLKAFLRNRDSRFDVVYREKLYGKSEYRTVHSIAYHRYPDKDTEYAVVLYDDVTDSFDFNSRFHPEFDSNVFDILDLEKVDPFVVVDAKTHELYLASAPVAQIWKPVKPFRPGITFEEYYFSPEEKRMVSLEDVLEKGEVIVKNSRTGGDLILSTSLIKWHGKDAIYQRISERADRYFDSLTGLPNMEYGRMCGENYADEIRNKGGTPGFVYFDIVGMKLYNSANGFDKGNEFLILFAASLKKNFDNNLIFRLPNDHFAVIADLENIEVKLNDIRKYIKSFISKISMDVHIGICKIDEDEAILDASEKAILACNVQKKTGEVHIRYYDEELRKALILQNYVVNHIDEAIANGYIKVYYQPVVRTITETFCGMEALARWIDPQHGFLNPEAFIGALEESRQIHKLDSFVVQLVCKEMRREMDSGKSVVPVSFNLSRLDFLGCDIFDVVEKALKKYDIDREYIRVEITESIMASDSYVRNEIERFRKVGYEVWMDDFGSGYSSLNTLKDYKFDELKIDMVFLSKFNEVSRTIIRSTVRMAKNLGLKTLAEGVETKEQMDFLKGIGCEKVQGYYYGKPMPLKDTIEHMASNGILAETPEMRRVYSKLGSLDFLVDAPKAIVSYSNGLFKFLFVNKQFEEQLQSLGFNNYNEVEIACNDPKNSAYYTLHEAEKAAYKAPHHLTYATRGTFVFLAGRLVVDIGDDHIYDLTLRNTHVSAFESHHGHQIVKLPGEAKTILLADVNQQNSAFLESILKNEYNLVFAEDGEEVLKYLLEYGNRISLALIDAALPKIDGFKIIQRFQNEHREHQIPFIIMTDNMELAKQSIRLGAYQFVHLPIKDKDMIKAKIDGAIKNTELLHQMALNYMEYVPGGIALFSVASGEMLYVNGRAIDIFECESAKEFRELMGPGFKTAIRSSILREDVVKTREAVIEQLRSEDPAPRQLTYRIKTKNGVVKRIYHVGKIFKGTPYGCVYSVFISEDDVALKNYFVQKDAFEAFMASGEATHTNSYEPGYKAFLFWNLTKNSPVLRMEGVNFIPKEMEGHYTYDNHCSIIKDLLWDEGMDSQKAADYTREKLIVDFMNKRAVPPLCLNYNLHGGWFTIKSTFEMMADPDSGDVILKLQDENNTDIEAYRELTDAVVMNLYDQILLIDGTSGYVLTLSSVDGKPMYVQRTLSDSIDVLCQLFQLKCCSVGQFLDVIQWRTSSRKTYGKKLTTDDGKIKFVRAKSLYDDFQKYIVTVSDITDASF